MKVLVWQGYGKTSVYEIKKGFTFQLKDYLLEIITGRYDEESIEEFSSQKTLAGILEWVSEYTDGDEMFDTFEVINLEQM